jgi:hypothetical protein
MITDTDVRAAEMRMQATLDTAPRAIAARYDRRVSRIVISLRAGVPSPHRRGVERGKACRFG